MPEEGQNIEELAKELGHTDLDTWTADGKDPEKWRSAEEFMEYGEKNAKFVRNALNKEMEKKMADLASGFDQRVKSLEVMNQEALAAQARLEETRRQQQISQWEKHRKDAAETDDMAEYHKATVAIEALKGRGPKAAQQPVAQAAQESEQSVVFHGKFMPLINQNISVKTYADDASLSIRRDNPNISEAEYFTELSTRIEEKFSDQFPSFFNKKPKKQTVDSSDGDQGSSGGRSYKDLPDEAKEACTNFVAQGILTKEQYVQKYFAE